RPSSENSHETASPGCNSSASLKVRSRSYMYEIPCQVAQVDLVRSQLAGLAVVTMRAMPPRLPSPPPSEESGEPLGDGVVALACPPSPPAGLVGSSEPPPQAASSVPSPGTSIPAPIAARRIWRRRSRACKIRSKPSLPEAVCDMIPPTSSADTPADRLRVRPPTTCRNATRCDSCPLSPRHARLRGSSLLGADNHVTRASRGNR